MNVKVDCSSLKTDMINTIKAVEDDMNRTSRRTLVDFDGLIRFVTADLEEGKTARFIEAPKSGVGFCWWPSLTLCTHEGALYQLWSTTALVGYLDADPNEDRQKVWIKVRQL